MGRRSRRDSGRRRFPLFFARDTRPEEVDRTCRPSKFPAVSLSLLTPLAVFCVTAATGTPARAIDAFTETSANGSADWRDYFRSNTIGWQSSGSIDGTAYGRTSAELIGDVNEP